MSENSFNLYSAFRLMLLGVTVYSGVDQVRTLLSYKVYYDELPKFLKQSWMKDWVVQQIIVKHGKPLLFRTLKKHQRDFVINGVLFGVLVLLNVVAFLY